MPNKFPAFEQQEVVVHSPEHVRSITALDAAQLGLVAEAWRARAAAMRGAGFPYVFAGVNEGKAAGSSLPHSHSQLAGFRDQPPVEATEASADRCRLCDYLAWEGLEQERIVLEREGLVLLCPYAGRAPYECLVAPLGHEPDGFESEGLGSALDLAADALRRLGPVPSNLWLHPDGHWHLELLPRLTVFASLELATGHHVNPLPPEQAAATLRAVS